MPLFRRCDGELVKNIDPIRRMMPVVMRGRNDSIIYHTTQWAIAEARAWLRHYNRTRGAKPPATLFHLVAYACVKMLHARPGLNRFVSGSRIYQRKAVWLSFAAKTRFADEAPLTTVKLAFPAGVSFDELVDAMSAAVNDARSGRPSRMEKEVRFLARLPVPLLRVVLATVRGLDHVNLLPEMLIEPDPMYSSVFLANLGSIHIGNAFHHLYEYGTCSLFGVVGAAGKTLVPGRDGQPAVRQVLQTQWSFDERVNDGFYCVESLEMMRRILEEPERHVERDTCTRDTNLLVPADVSP
jgi:pyruvate/2-oxoglutarate dehydrogenase complex dihydrolipoamide acyltransferase (E2) component